MADHCHKQIRDRVKTMLTGLTTTGSRVYANRLQPLDDSNLPALRIFVDAEEVETMLQNGQDRKLSMIVECCAKATTALDDVIDASSKEVEIALAGGIQISTNFVDCEYSGMQFDDALAEKPVGVKRMRFIISYMVQANAPDVFV